VVRQCASPLDGQVHHDGARLEHGLAGVAVDDRRDPIVWRDLEERRLELLVLVDVDRVHRIGQRQFLEQDRDLAAVRR
jgi:hypothetical protein